MIYAINGLFFFVDGSLFAVRKVNCGSKYPAARFL